MRIRTSTYFAQYSRYVTKGDDGFGRLTITPHDGSDRVIVEGFLAPTSESFQRRCDYYYSETGRIMPGNPDSRQQPKSLAHKMLAAHVAATSNRTIANVYRERTCTFMTDKKGGKFVFDRVTGKDLGYIMPSASPEVLAASPGIQSWSRPTAAGYVREMSYIG